MLLAQLQININQAESSESEDPPPPICEGPLTLRDPTSLDDSYCLRVLSLSGT